VLLDFRIDELTAGAFEPLERPLLVCSHQLRIGHHIGSEDRDETAFDGFSHGFFERD
jgi:hypothetical protein